MVDYQTLSIVLTGIGLIVAMTYYALQIRNQNKTRQAQLYNIWNQSMNNPHWQKNYLIFDKLEWNNLDEYLEKCPYSDHTSENTLAVWAVSAFYEGLSPIVRQGLLDLRFFFPSIWGLLGTYWNKLEPIVEDARERLGPGMWTESEYLYNTLKEYLEEHPELYP
jgi:hypothetical protein